MIELNSKDDLIAKTLAGAGLSLYSDGTDITIEPEYLKLKSIHIKTVKRGHIKGIMKPYDQLTDEDIFWVDEPVTVTAITESGNEINVYLSDLDAQVVHNHEVIDPRR